VEAARARWEQKRAETDRIIEAGKKLRACEDARLPLEDADVNAARTRDARIQDAIKAKNVWETAAESPVELAVLESRIESGTAFLQIGEDLDALRARLERRAQAEEQRSALRNEIALLNAPDPATWTAIQAVGREADEAQMHLEALVLRLELSADRELTAHIVSGDPEGEVRLAAGEKVVARGDDRLVVRLPGVGTIEVSGPTGDAAEWRARLAGARTELERLLGPFGVAKWPELYARVERRTALTVQVLIAEAECQAVLGNDALAALGERAQELAAEYSAILAAEASWAQEAPDVPALRFHASGLKLAWQQSQTAAGNKWQAAEALRSDAEWAAAGASAAWAANETALAAARAELASLEADGKTMAERLQELNNRRRECDSADEALREIDATLAALPADAPECAAAVLKRIEVLGSEIQAAREAYQQNEVAARTVLQQGPYTGLAAAEERVRQLEADEAAETLRLDAIRRLKNAVDSAKDEALAGIAEPVEARATRIVERIVGRPLARIQLGGSMELESVHPDGCSGAAVLEQMSAGEQEQIYFATRLALAEVLSEQERQVLVLDDPLVNTDGERIAESWI
jgi:hypothetical protein